VKERPIIFSAPSVRAILDGRKTMTRRPVRLPEIISEPGDADATSIGWLDHHESGPGWHGWMTEYPEEGSLPLRCLYGQPGDRLWVRESWQRVDPLEVAEARRGSRAPFTGCQGPRAIPWVAAYRADGDLSHPANGAPIVWRSPIHMPRWASRITLEIESVRVERLQDISSDDCIAEGVGDPVGTPLRYGSVTEEWNRRTFQGLWESINGPDSWAANPWVWVLSFKRVTP
jgi:hypothetical protein